MYSNIRIRSILLSPLSRHIHHQHRHSITSSVAAISNTIINNQTFSTKAATNNKPKKQTLQSYNETKLALKTYRTTLYNKKQDRITNLSKRRQNSPKNVKKNAFHQWFNTKQKNECYFNRLAKRNNQSWKIKLGIMIERLPVVTEDKEDWEMDYLYMKANLDRERSLLYPKEIVGFSDTMDHEVLTIEEIYG